MALIICGVPRSGTTLLRRLCDGHPDIAIASETRVFAFPPRPIWIHSRNISVNLARRTWSGVRAGRESILWPRTRFLTRYLAAVMSTRAPVVDTAAREAVLRRMYRPASIVGDKYPGYVFDLETHVEDPVLSCLVIYRDGRDVTSSTLRAVRTMWQGRGFVRNIDTVEKIARRWVFGVEQMLNHETKIHTVRYEDLVTTPQAVMAGIDEWLGVDPGKFPSGPVHATSMGKYRNGLTETELEMVASVAGQTLARLGYS